MINITEQEFQLLAQYIRKHFGIYLKKEKTKLLTGRLYQVLQKHGFTISQNITVILFLIKVAGLPQN